MFTSQHIKKNNVKKNLYLNLFFVCCLVHSQFAKNPIFMALTVKKSFIAVIIYERLRKFSFDFDFAKQT